MNLNTVESLCNFSSFISCMSTAEAAEMNCRWRLGQRWNYLYSPGANPWRANASCHPHWFWRHGCHSDSWMSCTSSPILVPPKEYTTAAISHHLFGCEFSQFLPCHQWVPPAIAAFTAVRCPQSCSAAATTVLLDGRAPKKVKFNWHRTKALRWGKKTQTLK